MNMYRFIRLQAGLLFLAVCPLVTAGTTVFNLESRPPAGRISGTLLPPPPHEFVHDETNVFSDEKRIELTGRLTRSSKNGIEVIVAILKEVPEVEPYQLGNELLLRWGTGGKPMTALILALPPVSPEPYLFIYDRSTEKTHMKRLNQIGAAAISAGEAVPDLADQLNATAVNLIKDLSEFQVSVEEEKNAQTLVSSTAVTLTPGEAVPQAAGSLLNATEAPQSERPTEKTPLSQLVARTSWSKMKPFVFVGGALLTLVFGGLLFRLILSRKARYFPEVEIRKRFSGPFSGGNNVIITFKRRKSNQAAHG